MIGRSLGRYRVDALLAEGRSGPVYRAWDALLDRAVALKLVPAELAADRARLERLRRDVQAAAAVVHRHIATLYELEQADGELFVTMELVEGRSLKQVIGERGLSVERLLELGVAVADALVGAREAAVDHGGLHSGEVLLAADGQVKVVGFGFAELRRTAGRGARPDLVSLGCILYEMATGRTPPAGEISDAARSARRLRPELPADLELILDRCLQAKPEPSVESVAEARNALEALRLELAARKEPEPQPTTVRHAESAPTGSRWLEMPYLAAAAAGVVVALALGGYGLWRIFARPGPVEEAAPPSTAAGPSATVAALPLEGLGGADSHGLARGLTREVGRLLAGDRELRVISHSSVQTYAGTQKADVEIGRELGADHLLRGTVEWERGEDTDRVRITLRLIRAADGAVFWTSAYDGWFEEILGLPGELARDVASQVLGPAGGTRRAGVGERITDSVEAYLAYLAGLGELSRGDGLEAAAGMLERAAALDPAFLLANTELTGIRLALDAAKPGAGHLDRARRSLEVARRLDPIHPEVHRRRGDLLVREGGDAELALEEYRAAMAGLPSDAGVRRAIALIRRRQGKWDEATEQLVAAVRLDPRNVDAYRPLIETLAMTRNFALAGQYAGLALTIAPEDLESYLLQADLLVRGAGAVDAARAVLGAAPPSARADPRWAERMFELDLYDGDYQAALGRLPWAGLSEAEALVHRAWVLRLMNRPREAATDYAIARRMLELALEDEPAAPSIHATLGLAYAGTYSRMPAINRAKAAATLVPVSTEAFAGTEYALVLARVHAMVGDHDGALDEISFLLSIPSPLTVPLLGLDPVWAPLRGLPRFQELVARHAAASGRQ